MKERMELRVVRWTTLPKERFFGQESDVFRFGPEIHLDQRIGAVQSCQNGEGEKEIAKGPLMHNDYSTCQG